MEIKALQHLDNEDNLDLGVWTHYRDNVDSDADMDDLYKTDRIDHERGTISQLFVDPDMQVYATLWYDMDSCGKVRDDNGNVMTDAEGNDLYTSTPTYKLVCANGDIGYGSADRLMIRSCKGSTDDDEEDGE